MEASDQRVTERASPAVRLTDAAVAKITEFAAGHEEAEGKHLRIYIQGGSKAAYEYGFTFDARHGGDEVLEQGGVDLLVDRFSLMYMQGSEVDFVDDVTQGLRPATLTVKAVFPIHRDDSVSDGLRWLAEL